MNNTEFIIDEGIENIEEDVESIVYDVVEQDYFEPEEIGNEANAADVVDELLDVVRDGFREILNDVDVDSLDPQKDS